MELSHVGQAQGGVWYQKCYDPECRQYRSEIMPLPPAIMQRLQADAASAALQSTAEPQRHMTQPSAQKDLNAMGQGTLLPSAPCMGDASSLTHAHMQPQLCGRHHEPRKENRYSIVEGPQTLEDIVCASGTGVFGNSSADDVFDKELLQLFERCER